MDNAEQALQSGAEGDGISLASCAGALTQLKAAKAAAAGNISAGVLDAAQPLISKLKVCPDVSLYVHTNVYPRARDVHAYLPSQMYACECTCKHVNVPGRSGCA